MVDLLRFNANEKGGFCESPYFAILGLVGCMDYYGDCPERAGPAASSTIWVRYKRRSGICVVHY